MYIIHKAEERGRGEHGWLHTRFSFSFADWYDPTRMGFGALRVINDDVIDPDSGFDLHPHSDMEIVTIVMEGAVTHGDSMDNEKVTLAGDVQVMSAGTGVVHSEHNNSLDETLKLFQIWILPKNRGVAPRYDQKSFGMEWLPNILTLLVSPDGREGSLMIHQDAFVYRGLLGKGQLYTYSFQKAHTHGVYLFVINGEIDISGKTLGARDAIGIFDAGNTLDIHAKQDSRFLLFEVPMI